MSLYNYYYIFVSTSSINTPGSWMFVSIYRSLVGLEVSIGLLMYIYKLFFGSFWCDIASGIWGSWLIWWYGIGITIPPPARRRITPLIYLSGVFDPFLESSRFCFLLVVLPGAGEGWRGYEPHKRKYHFRDEVLFITRNKEVCILLPEETIPNSENWETNRGVKSITWGILDWVSILSIFATSYLLSNSTYYPSSQHPYSPPTGF